jgi:hypothetical protein
MDAAAPNAGLCQTCMHASRVTSARGSTFVLCERSRTDPRFPRYPRLPVTACAGYEPHEQANRARHDESEQAGGDEPD